MLKIISRMFALAALAAAILPAAAHAESNLTRIIVPVGAGNPFDSSARALAEGMAKVSGKSVIVENKAGAGGRIATTEVARAAPDGATLLFTTAGHATNAGLYKNLPYDPVKDFTPILQAVRSATVLVANKDAPFSTTAEMIDYARAHPGKLNFGSYSLGSTSHLNGEILKQQTGIDIVHVPYKGTADASRALLAGEVQVYFDGTATAVENARAGKVKLLGPATDRRLSVLPDLPTLKEQGIPGLDIVGWQGIFGPGDMPPALAERVAQVFREALDSPDVTQSIVSQGNEVSGAGPKAFAQIVQKDSERWGAVIRRIGLVLQ